MTIHTRIAWAAACAALLAIPAAGMAANATIRVEGATSTLLSERAANIPVAGSATLVDSFDGDSNTVSNQSATSLLVRAVLDASLPVGFDVFNFGGPPSTFITRIGADAMPIDYSVWWKLKVNHVAAQVGTDDVTMHAGDEVLWTFGTGTEDELAVTGPTAPQQVGTPFTVQVSRYDDAAVQSVASGATVTYGTQQATTDATGAATLTTEPGWRDVVVTGANAVRDEARACGFAADHPEDCGGEPMVRTLPDVAPNTDISSVGPLRVSATTAGGQVIDIEVPVPVKGRAPVTISPDDLGDVSLSTDERRDVAGRLASSMAWQLNQRSADGDQTVAPPTGTRWRAAWLGNATTVAPLRTGEAIVSMRAPSRTANAVNAHTAQVASDNLAACGLDTHATVARRFGYAMVVIASPSAGGRTCLARARD